jgi:hypothetical protein
MLQSAGVLNVCHLSASLVHACIVLLDDRTLAESMFTKYQ